MYKLEKNILPYWDFILELRNDPRIKKGFIPARDNLTQRSFHVYADFRRKFLYLL